MSQKVPLWLLCQNFTLNLKHGNRWLKLYLSETFKVSTLMCTEIHIRQIILTSAWAHTSKEGCAFSLYIPHKSGMF